MTKEQLEKLDAMAKPRSEEAVKKAEERKKCWMNDEFKRLMEMDEKKIDWEQRRYEIAKQMLPCVAKIRYNASSDGDVDAFICADEAAIFADILIRRLKRLTDEETGGNKMEDNS